MFGDVMYRPEQNNRTRTNVVAKPEAYGCPVCRTITQQEIIYEKWGYPIFRCRACGLGSAGVGEDFDPTAIYNEDYFQGRRRDGYADYRNSEASTRAEFSRIVRKLRSFGPDKGRLLEIGCAYGFFLLAARQHYECVGLEISETAVESCRARGLNVFCQSITESFRTENGPFDAAVMLDVIEHLRHPAETISLLYDSLTPHGLLLITTGDWDSLMARSMKRHWRLMTPPQHLFYFSRQTLIELLEQTGFKVLDCSRPWKKVPIGLAAYQLGNRLGWRLGFLESLNWLTMPVNLFDTVQILARKE
jgi:SAM-dependent methyltransferase